MNVIGRLWAPEVIEAAEHQTACEGWCWCQPRVEHVLPFGEIYVHRHFWDRPEYGEERKSADPRSPYRS